jgi:O-antigen ligase
VLGTLSNPNFYSFEVIIFIIFVVANIIFINERKHKIINSIIMGLLFMTLILTQSRTALVVLFSIFLYIVIIQAIKGGRKKVFVAFLLIMVLGAVSFLLIKFMHLNYLFDAVKYGLKTTSFTRRIDLWKDAFNLFKVHPIVGIGPVIGKYHSAVDNEYIHILRNYGLFGLAAHTIFYFYIFIKTLRDIFTNKDILIQQYAFILNVSIIVVLITNLTMATFYHWRNFILLLIIICMWAKIRHMKSRFN